MSLFLIEPCDVLFFRDAIPMAAGQGKGAGCRMPFPSTVHEAFRASLLQARGEAGRAKEIPGRPRHADRKGNWHAVGHDTDVKIASKAFRSLRTVGPFPWVPEHGALLPVPLDVAFTPNREQLARLRLWFDGERSPCPNSKQPADFRPCGLPVACTPPDKQGQLHGWWTTDQFRAYLRGDTGNENHGFQPIPTDRLWQAEHRVGVQIDPDRAAAAGGRLHAGSYLRPQDGVRFAVDAWLARPQDDEGTELESLSWLLLGGEHRLARLHRTDPEGRPLKDPFAPVRVPPEPPAGPGVCLLKWVLVTPALFVHGSLPGWCADTSQKQEGPTRPMGEVCLDLPGRARLVSWCLGKPRTLSGWDVAEGRAKPTLLAVPEGSVYYFLCENAPTARELALKLHWQPRSDFYGEKGCGYGLVSFDVHLHGTSQDLRIVAGQLFTR